MSRPIAASRQRPFPYWTEKLDGGFTKSIFANRTQGHEVHVLRHPGGAVIGVWTTYSRHARSGQRERRARRLRVRAARKANR